MRILSIASLGSEYSEIPYSTITKSLHINENEVESWVILAINENIIEAKIDQLKNIIKIK